MSIHFLYYTKKDYFMKEENKINSYKEFQKKIKDYETQVKIICNSARPHNVLIVSGDPGIGKTYRAENILKNQSKVNYRVVTGSLSAVELYGLMWNHHDAIIVLDDVNSILQDSKDGASLLKACTESKPVRTLQWQKQNHNCIPVSKFNCPNNMKVAEKMDEYVANAGRKPLENAHVAGKTFPDMFYFTGAVIILTNKSLKSFDRVTEGAVSNRGTHMEISFTIDGAVDFIKTFGPTMTEYNGMKFKAKTIKDVIKFLTSPDSIKYYHDNGKIPTLRNLGKIEGLYQCGAKLETSLLHENTEYPYCK